MNNGEDYMEKLLNQKKSIKLTDAEKKILLQYTEQINVETKLSEFPEKNKKLLS